MNWRWIMCVSIVGTYFGINSALILVLLYHDWKLDEIQNYANILAYTEWVELVMNFGIICMCAGTITKWICFDKENQQPNQEPVYPPPPMNESSTANIQPPPLPAASNVNPYTNTPINNPFEPKYDIGYNPFGPEYNTDGS